ncbi:hypothetical protein [Streptomyces sp. Root369]|uniref:hypothetical protein n=1 Tax=Streptomyces sp. Root369 TaxID=1736523 RepID=UPI00070E028E|nr:hypothetical protein [Streptomyces sp. Root369]KQW13566.1 hypothetical protein ASD08_30855 [Streptomyces sp. Root369]
MAAFVCTLPSPPRAPNWEKGVQKFFQNEVWQTLHRLSDADPYLRVVEDEAGIAAAYTLCRWDSVFEEYSPEQGYGNRLIGYLAIAARYRGQGGALADEALTDALYTALDVEKTADRGILVWGKVHRRNRASKRMLTRHQFRYETRVDDDAYLEHWVRKIDR